MAFTFGATPSAAAPSTFGAAPAPAPTAFPSFGGTPSAAAPSTGFTGFGGASTPAPAAGGFSFGGTPGTAAPAPSTAFSGFGASSTPAPAPAFGASPATGAFGSQAPTSGAFGTSSFGAPSSTLGGFGSPAPAGFGTAPVAVGATPQQPPVAISGSTPYSALPQDLRQAIDTIHEAMMKHKKTMINLQSMAPALLLDSQNPAQHGSILGSNSGTTSRQQQTPIAVTIRDLHQKIAVLEQATGLQTRADSCKDDYEKLIKQAVMFGRWQIEALAVRRGVHLKPLPTDQQQQQQQQQSTDGGNPNGGQTSAKAQLQAVLDRQVAHVDRLERMPSPYLWQVLEDMEKRLADLKHHAWTVQQQLESSHRSNEPADVSSIVLTQHRALHKIEALLSKVHTQVEGLRQQYRFYEKGENVIEKANYEEKERERRLNDQIRMQYVKAAASAPHTNSSTGGQAPAPGAFGAPTPGAFGAAPAPAFGAFGSTPTPAPAFGGFGLSSTPAPAPAFGAFGASSTPAPAPAGTSTFSFGASANPAPAPSGTSTFGGFGGASTPAPAAGGAFGATPAPTTFGVPAAAPTTGFASLSSTPKKSSKGRNKNRLGR